MAQSKVKGAVFPFLEDNNYFGHLSKGGVLTMSKVVRSFLKPNYEGHKPQHPFFNFLGVSSLTNLCTLTF